MKDETSQKKTSRSPHSELTEKPRKRKALIKDLLKSEIITMILIIKNNDRVDITFLSPSYSPPTEISKNPEIPEQTHQIIHRIEEKNKKVEERLTNIQQTKQFHLINRDNKFSSNKYRKTNKAVSVNQRDTEPFPKDNK
jgi:hypothetical protein